MNHLNVEYISYKFDGISCKPILSKIQNFCSLSKRNSIPESHLLELDIDPKFPGSSLS